LLQVAQRLLAIVVFLLAVGFALGFVSKSATITRWLVPGAGLLADLAILISLLLQLLKANITQREEARDITIAGATMLVISILWVLLA